MFSFYTFLIPQMLEKDLNMHVSVLSPESKIIVIGFYFNYLSVFPPFLRSIINDLFFSIPLISYVVFRS